MPPQISICILACNEQTKIAHALESAKACSWAAEIVVFDSGSTDDTVAVARRYTSRVEFHPWVDFTTNRRKIVDSASHDWVFILDADEEISPELAAEIDRLDESAMRDHPVFDLPRKNFLLGRHVRAWDPDRVDRLFDRRKVRWPHRAIHDHPEPVEGSVGHLAGSLLHNRHADEWGDYFDGERYAKRADALARELLTAGRRARGIDLWLRPWVAFWKIYLLKGAFRDGAFGVLIAQKAAFSAQLKYARLWHLQQQTKSPQRHEQAPRREET